MRITENNGITLYSFESPAFESVTTFVTTRHNMGRTAEPRGNFNLGLYCGDDTMHVEANLQQLCNALDIERSNLFYPHQVHGTEVLCIDAKILALPYDEQLKRLDGIDAIVTDIPGIAIAVTTADCVPIILYDEVHHVVAAVHAGWRGTAQNILSITLDAMNRVYGTQPCDVMAGIGPCIGVDAYEVGQDVVEAMRDAGYNIESIATYNRTTGKMHIDLAAANADLLLRSGVDLMNIEVCGICTHSNSRDFYSVRALGNTTGRFLTGVMLGGK